MSISLFFLSHPTLWFIFVSLPQTVLCQVQILQLCGATISSLFSCCKWGNFWNTSMDHPPQLPCFIVLSEIFLSQTVEGKGQLSSRFDWDHSHKNKKDYSKALYYAKPSKYFAKTKSLKMSCPSKSCNNSKDLIWSPKHENKKSTTQEAFSRKKLLQHFLWVPEPGECHLS